MTIGGGIALIVIGAILAFGVELQLAGVDLDIIGMILMVAGVAGVVIGLVTRNRRVVEQRPAGTVVEERRDIV